MWTELPFADLKVHLALAITRVRAAIGLDRLLDRGVPFDVLVSAGVMAGAEAHLNAKVCRLGASLESSIALFDTGVADQHAEVHFKQSMFGPLVYVKAIEAPVQVGDQTVAPGMSTGYLMLPQNLTLGAAEIAIRPVEVRPRKPSAVWSCARMATAFFVAMVACSYILDRSSVRHSLALPAHQILHVAEPDLPGEVARLRKTVGDVKAKLTEFNLDSFLTAGVDPSGAIVLAGFLNGAQSGDWQRFQHWYDVGNHPVMVSNVAVSGDFQSLPPIASIRLSAPREVRLADGQRVLEGEALADMRLLRIAPTHLTVLRNGEEIDIPFPGGGDP